MWLGLTYACILSVSANLSSYFISHDQFVFDSEYIVRAFGVVLVFSIIMPLLVGVSVKCMKGDMRLLAVPNHINTVVVYIWVFADLVYAADCAVLYTVVVVAGWNAVFGGVL